MGENVRQKKDFRKPLPVERKKERRKPFSLSEFLHKNRYVIFLIGAGILLRFVDLGRQGLWIDEIEVT